MKGAGDRDEQGSVGGGCRCYPRCRRIFRCRRGPVLPKRRSLVMRASPAALWPPTAVSVVGCRLWLFLSVFLWGQLPVLRFKLLRFELHRAAGEQRRRALSTAGAQLGARTGRPTAHPR